LRHQVDMGLQSADGRFRNAGVYTKTTPKIPAREAHQTPTLPISVRTTDLRHKCPRPNTHRRLANRRSRGHITNTEGCREHRILCTRCRHDGVDGTIHHRLRTSQGHQADDRKHRATPRLPCKTHPDATMLRFSASNIILNIHSDASCLSTRGAKSRASGHFFLGWVPRDNQPIRLNGAFFTLCAILKFVAASAAEAELGALFMCAKEGRIYRLTLQELGHLQPLTPIHCDNTTAAGIANGTVKKQRSRSMEIRYFYICDQAKNGEFDVRWHRGHENLGDYASKHRASCHHKQVRPINLHEQDSPALLPHALRPSALRG
jgi:hypothetical protein